MADLKHSQPLAFRSSGDLLADNRYAYAKAAVEDGAHAEAAEILRQVLELVPYWAPALFMLGIAEDKLSHRDEAISALETAAALDVHDELGAGLQLARLGARPPPAAAGEAYVQTLFDQYAVHFEKHLVGTLGYRAPPLLFEAVSTIHPGTFRSALDLGCGTGLCGLAFRPRVQRLAGVDLSSGMIEEARTKAIYDRLAVANIEAFLQAETDASMDLLLAADVFVYIGDLAAIFDEAARVLMPGGLFAFTLQSMEEKNPASDFILGDDLRFAHSAAYIKTQIVKAGLKILKMEAAVTRQDAGHDVQGIIVVVERA